MSGSKSDHAEHRAKNRSVSDRVIDLLYNYGGEEKRGNAIKIFFDKKSRKLIRKHCEDIKLQDGWEQIYIIVTLDYEVIVTCCHGWKKQPWLSPRQKARPSRGRNAGWRRH